MISSAAPAAGRAQGDPTPRAALVQQRIITDEEYATALVRSEQSGHSVWTALRNVAGRILRGRAHASGQPEAGQDPTAVRPGLGPSGPLMAPDRFPSVPDLLRGQCDEAIR